MLGINVPNAGEHVARRRELLCVVESRAYGGE